MKAQSNKILAAFLLAAGILLASAAAHAQQRTVTGRVVDSQGISVISAAVVNTATKDGVITDYDGRFSIKAAPGQTLSVEMLGYTTKEIRYNGEESLSIVLEEDTQMLDDVVVVGYAVQKKLNVTGAVSSISGDELNARPVTSAMQALQGADPSMNIQMGSGSPVAGNSINIRGVPSVNGGSPLVLIDGVPGVSLDHINAADIESVSVLKDASASAIYGAKASAGVILVTTKSGSTGKTKVTYSNSFGWIKPTTSTDFITSGYDWAKAVDEVYYARYGYSAFRYTEEDWAALEARRYDKTENPERPWVVVDDSGQYHYYGNYDWYNALFNSNRFQQQHDLSVSGGTKAVRYYVSGKYYDQEGLLSGPAIPVKENYQNYAFRAKFDAQLFKWAKWSTNASLHRVHQVYPGTTNEALTISALDQALGPIVVPQNPDGSYVIYPYDVRGVGVGKGRGAILTNPDMRHDIDNRTLTLSNSLEITPFKGFSLKGTYNITNYWRLYRDRNQAATYSDKIGTIVTNTAYSKDEYRERHYEYNLHSVDVVATYKASWADKHHFQALAGMNFESRRTTDLTVDQFGVGNMSLSTFNSVNDDTYYTISQDITAYKTLGFFGRINYDYLEKYLFEASFRADGTSRFADGHRWGYFPSASFGWRFSREPFMAGTKSWLADGKLRFSYGALGNQQVSDYSYLETIDLSQLSYLFDGSGRPKYASVSDPVSSSLTWETVGTYNFGLDLSLLDGRLNFTGDYFIRETKDMLTTSLTLPSVYGASTPKENCADLRTNGWEVQLGWKDQFKLGGKPFQYGVTGTLGDYRTIITKFNNPDRVFSNYYVGKELGEIWGYHIPKLFSSNEEAAAYQVAVHQASNIYQRVYNMSGGGLGYLMAGDMMFEDVNGDGYINSGEGTVDNPGDMMIIGNSLPHYNYSMRFDFAWNNFDLGIFFQGVGKRNWYPSPNQDDVYGGSRLWNLYGYTLTSFISTDYKDNIWTEENPDGYFPRLRPIQSYNGGPLGTVNDRYLQDVSYLRLKNVTFGYTIPFKKSFISSCRLYFAGENLWYWSPMKKVTKYVDPELAVATGTYITSKMSGTTGTGYTMPLTLTMGLNINF
ncbi:MAG: TonB-dependent receptor [Bacteroidales bacterium]|nr:TonB-dependent receptor [Bacteroidales bacterium]